MRRGGIALVFQILAEFTILDCCFHSLPLTHIEQQECMYDVAKAWHYKRLAPLVLATAAREIEYPAHPQTMPSRPMHLGDAHPGETNGRCKVIGRNENALVRQRRRAEHRSVKCVDHGTALKKVSVGVLAQKYIQRARKDAPCSTAGYNSIVSCLKRRVALFKAIHPTQTKSARHNVQSLGVGRQVAVRRVGGQIRRETLREAQPQIIFPLLDNDRSMGSLGNSRKADLVVSRLVISRLAPVPDRANERFHLQSRRRRGTRRDVGIVRCKPAMPGNPGQGKACPQFLRETCHDGSVKRNSLKGVESRDFQLLQLSKNLAPFSLPTGSVDRL